MPSSLFTSRHRLTCEMVKDCSEPVTHIDQDGYIYCADHGVERRTWKPCRKLRTWELHRIERTGSLRHY